ncbi:hypothetical protein V7D15_07490 [Thermoanaerobacter thermohydrosulfuricus]
MFTVLFIIEGIMAVGAIVFFIRALTKPKKRSSFDISSIKEDEEEQNITTAQEFLPFDSIINGMIKVNDRTYVKLIAVDNINLLLLSAEEQLQAERNIAQFFNMIKGFEIKLVTQSKRINHENRFLEIEQNIKKAPNEIEQFYGYSVLEYYRQKIRREDLLQKQHFIVIIYEDNNPNLSKDDVFKHASEELEKRANILINELINIGLHPIILNDDLLGEILYETFNRGKEIKISYLDALESGHNSLFVGGIKNVYLEKESTKIKNTAITR